MGLVYNVCGIIFGMILSSFIHEKSLLHAISAKERSASSTSSSSGQFIYGSINTQQQSHQSQNDLHRRLETCAQNLEQIATKLSSSSSAIGTTTTATTTTITTSSQILNDSYYNSGTSSTAAICAIQKGGLYYMDEWVDYHLALGFQTIYIYDNSDNFELEAWANSRNPQHVVVHHFPGERQQISAYKQCLQEQSIEQQQYDSSSSTRSPRVHSSLRRAADPSLSRNIKNNKQKQYKNDWLAFIDIDEFIVLKNHSNIVEMLEDLVPNDKAGLALSRLSFWFNDGINHHASYEPIPVTKRFQTRINDVHEFGKTIAKTSQILRPDVHYVSYRGNKQSTVDTEGHKVTLGLNQRKTLGAAVIHHYETKSVEEFQSKCDRGDAVHGTYAKKVEQHQRHLVAEGNKNSTFSTGGDSGNGKTSMPPQPVGNQKSCKPKEELIHEFRSRADSIGETFDDSAWKFLYTAVPLYTSYNTVAKE